MSPSTEHPRPARLTVQVGVTGHRAGDLKSVNQEKLRRSICRALQCIERTVWTIHADAVPLYSSKRPLLRLLSSLADGADQIVAKEALELGFQLHCPLPFSPIEYAAPFDDQSKEDFASLLRQAETVLQLDGSPQEGAPRDAAYLAAGRLIVGQCDVLIAVWDGERPKGLGGTGQIVDDADNSEIPILWINPSDPESVRLRTPKSTLMLESPDGLSLLGKRLRESLLPATTPAHGSDSWHFRLRNWLLRPFGKSLPDSEWDRALAFFREAQPHRWWHGRLFRAYRFLWTGFQQPVDEPEEAWNEFIQRWPAFGARFENNYRNSFWWADELAKACVGKYRDSFIVSYLLGAFAVLFAFGGLQAAYHAGAPDAAHAAGIPWFIVELVLILSILGITLLGSFFRWHECWMDYRPLAEALRQMRFLGLLGRVPPSSKVPAHLAPGDPGRSWFNWYFRALVRQTGMIGGSWDRLFVLNSLYLEDVRGVLAEAIKGQISYHESNHRTFHDLHHRSHLVAQAFFVATALGCTLHLFHQPRIVEVGLGFVAIVLPGFGAALSAILHQGEFERIALRSKALRGRLLELSKELQGQQGAAAAQPPRVADTFSDIVMAEMVDWRFAFLGKDLTLP